MQKKNYDELQKRYIYLQENKELILAMCIKKECEKEYYLGEIKRLKSLIKNAISQDIKDLMITCMNDMIKKLNMTDYYLCKEINEELSNAFEEFILGDKSIEETSLFKHIESVKKSDYYLILFNELIEELENRRKKNMHLSKVPTFTVWKILTYVRRKNLNNKIVKEALDKYYNLERYFLIGDDSNYGFIIPKGVSEEFPNYPSTDIITYGKYGGIISAYRNNEFETEDDYYNFFEEENDNEETKYYSKFALELSEEVMPTLEMKQIIKEKIYGRSRRITQK